jgi:23S rRNA pseudouridine2457 synthase
MPTVNEDNLREPFEGIKKHQHFKIFKPYNCLSQFVQERMKNKKLLGDFYDFPDGTMAIGRLDHDSG